MFRYQTRSTPWGPLRSDASVCNSFLHPRRKDAIRRLLIGNPQETCGYYTVGVFRGACYIQEALKQRLAPQAVREVDGILLESHDEVRGGKCGARRNWMRSASAAGKMCWRCRKDR